MKNLSGKTHIVYTGFAICDAKSKKYYWFWKTKVTFYNLSDKQIEDYVNTGSPMDKAGAYGIQDDFGALFVKKLMVVIIMLWDFQLQKFSEHLKN